MTAIVFVAETGLIAAVLGASWLLPRTLGLLGLFLAHVCCVCLTVAMGAVAVIAEIAPIAYEPEMIFLLILAGFAIDVFLLPVSITAMIRWRRLSPLSTTATPAAAPRSDATGTDG